MSWVRLDDAAPDHPKLVGLDDEAFALWVRGLCYCARHSTDGRIPAAALPRLTARRPPEKASKLVAAGLWEADGEGFQVHDFLDYHPSAEASRARRETRAAAGKAGGLRSGEVRSKREASASGVASTMSNPARALPVPSRPVPDPSGGAEPVPVPSSPPSGETPDQRAWRTWRAAYQHRYGRAYPKQTTDGPAMQRATRLAVDLCRELGKPTPEDVETLLLHRWRKYLADPGQSRQPGGPGYLTETCHRLQDFERGVAAYGTPWDRKASAAQREPEIAPPARERVRR